MTMNKDGAGAPLSRTLKADEIRDGASGEIVAQEAEMAAIARMLDLARLEGLAFVYRFARTSGGHLRLTGKLTAKLTQTCVVSLDPVETELGLLVEVEFWPVTLVEELVRNAEESGSHEILDWPEPILDGTIDLGSVIYESLATAIDPYPKREGANFQWTDRPPEASEAGNSGPFAALATLRRR
jgi:hypothetical protein